MHLKTEILDMSNKNILNENFDLTLDFKKLTIKVFQKLNFRFH